MKHQRSMALLAPLVVLGALVAGCVPPPAPGPGPSTTTTTMPVPPHVIPIGHIDAFEVTINGSALKVQIEDETGPSVVYRDPAQTILHVKPQAQIAVPNPPGAFAFLGAAGAPVWLLPQVQNANLLWPGASTERITSGSLQANTVDWTIQSVSGPGSFHVYQNGAFGAPQLWFSSGSGFPQTQQLSVPQHAHFNWAFGAAGTYTVVMRANATMTNGTPVTSGNVAYTFRVGPL